MDQTPNEATHLIERLRAGDRRALAELFDRYRDRLRRMVALRMDPRLRARLDAADVLQEAYLEQLSRSETAEVLGIGQEAGAKRYFRALKRLKGALASMPGGSEGM
jgi:DNA-directed RNA polymerase specialized sigma24 family protein